MLSVEQIHEWRGEDVLDRDGEKIGKLDEVFYDAGSGEAIFASVKSGLLGRHSNLVPLAGATVGKDYVRVAHTAEVVEGVETGEDDGRLDSAAAQGAADTYHLQIAEDAMFESATLITERQERAAEAARRAEELEQEAQARAEEASAVRHRATDTERDADGAEQEFAEARQAAQIAREQADRSQTGTATQRNRET